MTATFNTPDLFIAPKFLPFGLKASRFAQRPPEQDRRINILEGAVRSSKTWACIPKILALSIYPVAGHRILFGVTKQTIYNNVLDDLFEVLGPDNYSYNRQSGELEIIGTRWQVVGAKDEGSEKYIRGITVGVALGDELTLIPPNFVKMLLNRMSPAGARFYATTNPDSPFHYVYTDLLTNKELIERGVLWSEHFDLDDNPNISGLSDSTPEGKAANVAYKNYLRSLYKGVYYQRFVLGLWVVAEGAIYKDAWSEDLLYSRATAPKGLGTPGTYAERHVSLDYGTDHPQVYLDCIDDGKTVWVDRQYFWDSNLEMRQKTDSQYADDLEAFLPKTRDAQVIVPPECASFRAELVQRGVWVTDADNEVNDGIRVVAVMMAAKRIRVRVEPGCAGQSKCLCGTQCCCQLAKEIPTYSWDPKKALRGEEEPLKTKDDSCDALRYEIKTKIPAWRLGALK